MFSCYTALSLTLDEFVLMKASSEASSHNPIIKGDFNDRVEDWCIHRRNLRGRILFEAFSRSKPGDAANVEETSLRLKSCSTNAKTRRVNYNQLIRKVKSFQEIMQ